MGVPFAGGGQAASQPSPGDIAPAEVREAIDRAVDRLRTAMKAKDHKEIEQATEQLREALGPWAGVPERRPEFVSPPDPDTSLTRERLARLWRAAWAKAQKGYRAPGRWGLPADHPEAEHTMLRETAYVVSGGLAGLRHRVADHPDLRRKVEEGLAYLLSVQQPDGLFPFPDVRSWHRHFRGPLESLYQQHPEAFQKGWIIDDFGDGGLQFDNGVCAAVLIEAWEQLGEDRYREAARRACRWAAGRPVVPNWNYNAFTVWAMARHSMLTGSREFVESAIEKARLGVLPGQLPDGRWVDQHNARTVYHAIILRGLACLYGVLPADSPHRVLLGDAVRRAERVLVDELYAHGATDADHSLTALSAVQDAMGASPRRTAAMRIIINAMYKELTDGNQSAFDDAGMFAAGEALDVFVDKER
jgi:hypothetical protein